MACSGYIDVSEWNGVSCMLDVHLKLCTIPRTCAGARETKDALFGSSGALFWRNDFATSREEALRNTGVS